MLYGLLIFPIFPACFISPIAQQLQSFEQHIILFNHLELNVMLWIQIQLSCSLITYAIAAINTPSLFPLFLEVKRKKKKQHQPKKTPQFGILISFKCPFIGLTVWYWYFDAMHFEVRLQKFHLRLPKGCHYSRIVFIRLTL